jgi:hypothetical protein
VPRFARRVSDLPRSLGLRAESIRRAQAQPAKSQILSAPPPLINQKINLDKNLIDRFPRAGNIPVFLVIWSHILCRGGLRMANGQETSSPAVGIWLKVIFGGAGAAIAQLGLPEYLKTTYGCTEGQARIVAAALGLAVFVALGFLASWFVSKVLLRTPDTHVGEAPNDKELHPKKQALEGVVSTLDHFAANADDLHYDLANEKQPNKENQKKLYASAARKAQYDYLRTRQRLFRDSVVRAGLDDCLPIRDNLQRQIEGVAQCLKRTFLRNHEAALAMAARRAQLLCQAIRKEQDRLDKSAV